jgi:acyl-CoA synthetase (AMP-forming)/AMP-acid ligase II
MRVLDRVRSIGVRVRAGKALLPHVREIFLGARVSPASLLEQNARDYPAHTALLHRDDAFTWADVNAHANRWARFFAHAGVTRGDVVGLVMDNRPEYVFALLAVSKLGAVTACVNTNLSGPALSHALGITKTRFVMAGSEHEAAVRDVLPRVRAFGPPPRLLVHRDADGTSAEEPINAAVDAMDPSDLNGAEPSADQPTSFLYTSGTTGLPKAAVITNQRFMLAAYGFGKVMHESAPGDVIYVALPLYHGTGQWGGLGAALATGAAIAIRRRFSASSFWKDAVRYRATHVMYIGELCRYLLQTPPAPEDRLHSVRVAVGNGLRPDVWEPFQSRFGIPLIREFYGSTEGNAIIANLEGRQGMLGRRGRSQAIVKCDLETGKPYRGPDGHCVRIEGSGATGLLVGRISRLHRFDGYVDRGATDSKILRDVFAKGDAFFNSGDLVTLHDDDWLSFADRVGDTFRWKGENVSTSEVALLLNGAPGVTESNVFGVTLPGSEGKAGMACLVVAPHFDLGDFARYAEEKLPKYARPLFVRLLHDMRVTSTLKHQKGDYRHEGYDPSRVADPLFASIAGHYEPVTAELHREICAGKISLG